MSQHSKSVFVCLLLVTACVGLRAVYALTIDPALPQLAAATESATVTAMAATVEQEAPAIALRRPISVFGLSTTRAVASIVPSASIARVVAR